MKSLLALAEDALSVGEKCILCSVVRLQGSGYGRVGARLMLTESGERTGYISGGCLEKDLCRRAFQEAHTHPKLLTFDTRGNRLTPSRYSTGCEGIVSVLCQPFTLTNPLIRVAMDVARQRRAARLLTVYRSQWPGVSVADTFAQFSDGADLSATWNETCPLARLFEQLLQDMPSSFTATVSNTASSNSASSKTAHSGTTHSGGAHQSIDLVVEQLEPARRLVIFGAGDDVQPLVRMAIELGWEVCVCGKHPDLAHSQRFPGAHVHRGDFAELARTLAVDEFTHVISMSHDFQNDLQLVPLLVKTEIKSLGLLGSKRRLAKLLAELHYRGDALSASEISRLRSPVGLDLGSESPSEIAMSIMAELMTIESGSDGRKLSDGRISIHSHLPHHEFTLQASSIPSRQTCHAQLS